MPLELSFLWDWFQELHAARGSNGWGPNPLTFSDIAAWAGLTGVAIRAPELQCLVILDRLWLQAQSEAAKARQDFIDQQRRSRQQTHGR
jgi:hypothetical protein